MAAAHTQEGRELKTFEGIEIKVSSPESNEFTCKAAGIGNMDRGGDVLLPGCFNGALKGFLKNGVVLIGHGWMTQPVAMPLEAEEVGDALVCRAKFHSDPDAQKCRTVMLERVEAGLTVGISIGFRANYSKNVTFENGESLLAWCKSKGYKGLKEKEIAAWKGYCRAIPEVSELYEYSIVNVPMNPAAVAVRVKDLEGGTLSGLSLERHLETALSTVKGATLRLLEVAEKRNDQGQSVLSPMRFEDAIVLKSELESALEVLNELISLSAPGPSESDVAKARALASLALAGL